MRLLALVFAGSAYLLSLNAGTLFLDEVYTYYAPYKPPKKSNEARPQDDDYVPGKTSDMDEILELKDIQYGTGKVMKEKSLLLSILDLNAAQEFYRKTDPKTVALADMDLYLDIYRPDDREAAQKLPPRLPAVIFAHGGGFIKGSKNQGSSFCVEFAQRGYVAVSIQYRLAWNLPPIDEPGPSPTTNLPPQWIMASANDMIKAVNWLKDNADTYNVDPSRIAVAGLSAGGGACLGAAYLDPADFPPDKETRAEVAAVLPFSGGLAGLEYIIDADDPPAFIVHSRSDTIAPFKYALDLMERLEAVGVDYSLMTADNMRHAISLDELNKDGRTVEGKQMLQHLFEFCFEKLNLIELLPQVSEPKPIMLSGPNESVFEASISSYNSDAFRYQLYLSENAKDWFAYGEPLAGTGDLLEVSVNPGGRARFYRWETRFNYQEVPLGAYKYDH